MPPKRKLPAKSKNNDAPAKKPVAKKPRTTKVPAKAAPAAAGASAASKSKPKPKPKAVSKPKPKPDPKPKLEHTLAPRLVKGIKAPMPFQEAAPQDAVVDAVMVDAKPKAVPEPKPAPVHVDRDAQEVKLAAKQREVNAAVKDIEDIIEDSVVTLDATGVEREALDQERAKLNEAQNAKKLVDLARVTKPEAEGAVDVVMAPADDVAGEPETITDQPPVFSDVIPIPLSGQRERDEAAKAAETSLLQKLGGILKPEGPGLRGRAGQEAATAAAAEAARKSVAELEQERRNLERLDEELKRADEEAAKVRETKAAEARIATVRERHVHEQLVRDLREGRVDTQKVFLERQAFHQAEASKLDFEDPGVSTAADIALQAGTNIMTNIETLARAQLAINQKALEALGVVAQGIGRLVGLADEERDVPQLPAPVPAVAPAPVPFVPGPVRGPVRPAAFAHDPHARRVAHRRTKPSYRHTEL
jgi:hypothetical protein